MQEDQNNVTPDSSTTVNSKADIDNSLIMFQVMLIVDNVTDSKSSFLASMY
jgi:hypothetical protein